MSEVDHIKNVTIVGIGTQGSMIAFRNALYGKMHVTVGDRRDEMEFEMDLIALAEKFGIKASDIKLIEARFGRIGQQWISTAGTSTGTWLGIGACLAVTGGMLLHEKRRREAAV